MQIRHRLAGLLAAAWVALGASPALAANERGHGLSAQAYQELRAAGLDKYLGQHRPAQSQMLDGGWVRHTFDPQGGNGPICITGTPYTAYTKARNPTKVMVYLNGGGACWQGFYNCTPVADAQPPAASGVFADAQVVGNDTVDNPLADYSVVYGSYCDGSVFAGDKAVADPLFPGGVRHHRGVRNASAVMDLAKANFPRATHVVLAGSSAGGLGVAAFTPLLARMTYGNIPSLLVLNDAGPTFTNLMAAADVNARAADWAWGQFLPASCHDCNDKTHFTPLQVWRMQQDATLREAMYATDADAVLRFFLKVPTQVQFRNLLLDQTQILADAYPQRFKRFVRSGTNSHTMLRGPLFYEATANGVPLTQWTRDFLINRRPGWVDLVEPLSPAP